VRWVEELLEISDAGVTILGASFPETLEIEPEVQPDLFVAAFQYFVKRDKRLPPILRDLTVPDLNALRAAFAESALSLLMTELVVPASTSKIFRRREA
jgi:hypothetical protein